MLLQNAGISTGFRFRKMAYENWPLLLVILLFCLLWLPHVFIINNNIDFITAFELDPGGMMESVKSHLSSYNMNEGYFSKYYGWTFFFITFLLLKPTTLILKLLHLYNDSLLFFMIRLVNFALGLSSAVVLYLYQKRLFNRKLLAALGSLFYLIPAYLVQGETSWFAEGSMINFFYFIHPELAGLLFLALSLWQLEVFKANSQGGNVDRQYFLGCIFIVLSIYAKQPFLFVCTPIYFLYLQQYAHSKGISVFGFIRTRHFAALLSKTVALSALILYIINPYAVLHPKSLISNQLALVRTFDAGSMTLSLPEAWKAYFNMLQKNLFLIASILISLINIVALALKKKPKEKTDFYFLTIFISSMIAAFFFISTARYFISLHYLAPISIFLIVGDLFLFTAIVRLPKSWLRNVLIPVLSSGVLLFFTIGAKDVIQYSVDRLHYRESSFYKVYQYIENNVPNGSRIAVSSFVAVPPEKGLQVFQWWKNDINKLGEFNPDYLIYQEHFNVNGVIGREAEAFNAFVSQARCTKIAVFGYMSVFRKSK